MVDSDRPLLDKLGVKPGHRISLIGGFEPEFVEDLKTRGAAVTSSLRRDSDMIFLMAKARQDLKRIATVRDHIKNNGAIWVVRVKGKQATLSDVDLINAGLAAGLVDNKIASFSDRHSAMRYVFRLRDR